jgi:hypothetical protein
LKTNLFNQKAMLTKAKNLNRNGRSLLIVFLHMFLVILMTGVFFSCQKKEEVKLLKIGLPEEPKSLNL